MATYLYRKECPQGRIFNTQEEVEEAVKNGWVDAPGKWDEPPSRSDGDIEFFGDVEVPDEGKSKKKGK